VLPWIELLPLAHLQDGVQPLLAAMNHFLPSPDLTEEG
jgi:hypothetical protein